MKISSASLLVISAALLASSTTNATPLAFNADDDQISVPIQVPFSATPRVLTLPNWFHHSSDDDGDICPQLPVQCCATQCTARGPLGGKADQISHTVEQGVEGAKQKWGVVMDGDEDDICPDMKVSCKNKDGETVGSIGKKPFCRDGVTCGQCHQTENSVECNAKFVKECKAQCEATGPLGGKGVFTYLY
ncbi:hypothetical protein NDA13_004490 [Ustilago tritici]|nr:hypothetical protein NDA13_004490 [Ustilago tritici]